MPDVLVEVCLDSVESAAAAEHGGAQRVELCDNLVEGGTTPSAGMIAATRDAVSLGIMVMIRPRGGDFCYSARELDVMGRDIRAARDRGADGVVFGVLTPDGRVDEDVTSELVELARPMSTTFHRAFDVTRDPLEALDTLILVGVDRILTSGQEASVVDGCDTIRSLQERAAGRIVVMPGCGITPVNVAQIVRETRATEVHVVGTKSVESPMAYRNPRVFMGKEEGASEYVRTVTDAEVVRALVAAASRPQST